MNFRWYFLPYCLIRQADGSWMVVNRDYKPLGYTGTAFVDYGAHAVAIPKLTEAVAQRIDVADRRDTDRIYLYNDGCVPTSSDSAWTAYAERLHVLSKLNAG